MVNPITLKDLLLHVKVHALELIFRLYQNGSLKNGKNSPKKRPKLGPWASPSGEPEHYNLQPVIYRPDRLYQILFHISFFNIWYIYGPLYGIYILTVWYMICGTAFENVMVILWFLWKFESFFVYVCVYVCVKYIEFVT